MVVTNYPIPYRWKKELPRVDGDSGPVAGVSVFSRDISRSTLWDIMILFSWARFDDFCSYGGRGFERPVAGRCETGEWRWRASCRWSIGHICGRQVVEPALGDRYDPVSPQRQ